MASPHQRAISILLAILLLAIGCGGEADSVATGDSMSERPTAAAADKTPSSAEDQSQGDDVDPDADASNSADAPAAAEDEPQERAELETTELGDDTAAEPAAPAQPPALDLPTGITPVRISIPAIDVDAPTIELSIAGIEPEVPTDFADTGWYTQTRLPGEIGPAVIAGHIDSRSGPAVFARLDQLVPGDEIIVYDEAGTERTFEVVDAEQHPKGDLPPGVFGFDQPVPELRLITCGGTFDESSGHYRDNYIVYAVAV